MAEPLPETAPPFPLPTDPGERYRVERSALGVRVLTGAWASDQEAHILAAVGPRRARQWGRRLPILNPLADLAAQVSVLHVEPPILTRPGGTEADAGLPARLQAASLWPILNQAQHYAEALGDVGVGVDVIDGAIVVRLITPDLLSGVSRPGRPGVPGELAELHLMQFREPINGSRLHWVHTVYDCSDAANPRLRHLLADGKKTDVTGAVYVDQDGRPQTDPPYRWRHVDTGRGLIPIAVYHAQAAPLDLFSPGHRGETLNLTLELAVLAAAQDSGAIHASHPQRWTVDVEPVHRTAAGVAGEETQRIESDSTSVMQFASLADGRQPQVGQWTTAAPTAELSALIEARIGQAAIRWGLSPGDIQRNAADPRSGLALVVSEAAKRRIQAARAPIYRPQDLAIVGKIAALLNADAGAPIYSETGWEISYTPIPLTPQERQQLAASATAALDAGLLSRAEARAMLTGEPLAAAQAALATFAPPAPSPASPPPPAPR